MRNLILIGAGDMGIEVWSWIENAKGFGEEFMFKGFLDSNPNSLDPYDYCDSLVLGNEHDYVIDADDIFVCTIANPYIKEKVVGTIQSRGGEFMNLIHKSVIQFKNIQLGKGIVVSPFCVISNNCRIGDHVSINISTTLGHDVKVGRFSQINSHCDITGHVNIGEKVFIGTSVCIIPKIEIGEGALLGAGSVVVKNVNISGSVFGNPAREIKRV